MSETPRTGGEGKRLYCEVDGMQVELDPTDLSAAGLFVQTTAMLEPESEVDIYLRSEAGSLNARAMVVQVVTYEQAASEGRKPGFGLLFANLNGEQRTMLESTRSLLAMQKPAGAPSLRAGGISGNNAKAARKRMGKTLEPQRAPQAKPPCALNPEARRTLEKLETELEQTKSKSPWAILGLESGSEREAARAAYFTASKRYHPHQYARYDSDDITRVVTELFIAHKRAYSTIEKTSIAPPDAGPLHPGGASMRPDGGSSLRPSKRQQSDLVSLINEGMRCLAAQRFVDAESCFTRALDKKEDEAQAALWLQLCRARRARSEGNPEEAAQHYGAALQLDPNNKEAQAGAAVEEKKGGLFGRIFKAGNG